MKQGRATRGPGLKRTFTWLTLLVAVGGVFVYMTWPKGPGAIFSQALLVGLAMLSWALAVLFWDLAVVWIDYVSKRRHVRFLQERWGVTAVARRADRAVGARRVAPDQPTGLWWIDTAPASAAEAEEEGETA